MKTELIIRNATPAEKPELEELQRRASLNNPGDREALLAHPDAIGISAALIESGFVFVAERDGAAVGFAAIAKRSDGDIELDGLFVEPDAWRQGVGRALVEKCAAEAARLGAAVLHVVGNAHALSFYRALGFEQTGVHKTRFGEGLLMQRRLRHDR